jgi:prepilin-type N-terminal cleavage/methylation domain-containing protein
VPGKKEAKMRRRKNFGFQLSAFRFSGGFTLIELVTVIAIIAVLAGLLMPALHRARVKALDAKAKSMIASLQLALSMYETDYGVYPQSANINGQVNGNSKSPNISGYYNLVKALSVTTGGGPYMQFKNSDLDGSLSASMPVLLDPWRRAYVYVSQKYWNGTKWADVNNGNLTQGPFWPNISDHSSNGYNIYSLGVDGKTYNGASVVSYPANTKWDVPDMYNSKYDGDTASGVAGNSNLKWLLDDINSWQ